MTESLRTKPDFAIEGRNPGFNYKITKLHNYQICPNRDHDHDRPNHDHGASDVRVRPTTDGVLTSTAPAVHAVHAVRDLPAGCAVHDAQWPDEDRALRARCAAGTCHDHLREDAVQR